MPYTCKSHSDFHCSPQWNQSSSPDFGGHTRPRLFFAASSWTLSSHKASSPSFYSRRFPALRQHLLVLLPGICHSSSPMLSPHLLEEVFLDSAHLAFYSLSLSCAHILLELNKFIIAGLCNFFCLLLK